MSQLTVREKAVKKTKSAQVVDQSENSKNKVEELLADDWSDDEPESESGDPLLQINDPLSQVIESIWDKYDDDGNGSLDIDEARHFVQDILKDLGDEEGNIF